MNPVVSFVRSCAVGVALLAGSSGCALDFARDPALRHYRIPPGSSVVVRAPIPIPPDGARAFIQDGRTVPQPAIRRYEPYCEVEVNTVEAVERSVPPGRYGVGTVSREQWAARGLPVLLAAAGRVQSVSADRDGSPLVLNVVRFALRSEPASGLRELRCTAGWNFAATAVFPTLAEMQRVLGELVEIELPR